VLSVADAGRPGQYGYRIGESILATWISQNLSRGSGTLVVTASNSIEVIGHLVTFQGANHAQYYSQTPQQRIRTPERALLLV
jgi:hypothetical protein